MTLFNFIATVTGRNSQPPPRQAALTLQPIRRAAFALLIVTVSQTACATDESADKSLINIIEAIEQGWEQADGTPFRRHFLDFEGARYVESGGQNAGLSDLIDHHVEPEGDALDGLDLNFSNIETHVEGDMAWAIADVEVRATVKKDGRVIHNRGYETFLFRAVNGEWKVIHTHSSSRPVKPKTEAEHKH